MELKTFNAKPPGRKDAFNLFLSLLVCALALISSASAATVNFAFHDSDSNAIPNTKVIVSPVSGPSVSAQWVTGGNTSWFTTASDGTGQLASMPPGFYGVRLFTSPAMIFEISVPPGGGTYNASDITVPFPWLTFAQTYFAPTAQTVETTNQTSALVLTTNGSGGLIWTLFSATNSTGTAAAQLLAVTVKTTNATSSVVLSTNGQGIKVLTLDAATNAPNFAAATVNTTNQTSSLAITTNGNTVLATLYSATNSPGGAAGSSNQFSSLFYTNLASKVDLRNPPLTNNQTGAVSLGGALSIGGAYTGNGSGLSSVPVAALADGPPSNIVATAADGTHVDTNAIAAQLIGIVPAANLPIATSSTPGIVKPDNASTTVDGSGVLHSTLGGPQVNNQFTGNGTTSKIGFIGPTTNLVNLGDLKNHGVVYSHYVTVSNTITFPGFNEQIGDDGSGNLSIYNPFGVVNINGSSLGADGDGTLEAGLVNAAIPVTDLNGGIGANTSNDYFGGDGHWHVLQSGGGSQTPLAQNVDAAQHDITNASGFTVKGDFGTNDVHTNGLTLQDAGGVQFIGNDGLGDVSLMAAPGYNVEADSAVPGDGEGNFVAGTIIATDVFDVGQGEVVFNSGQWIKDDEDIPGLLSIRSTTGVSFDLLTQGDSLGIISFSVEMNQSFAGSTIAPGAGAGTSPTVGISISMDGGQIAIATGSAPSSSAIVATITYGASFPWAVTNQVILSPANASAAVAMGQLYVSSRTNQFTINSIASALSASTTYLFNFK